MGNLVITPSGGSAITFVEMTDGCTASANRYWISYPWVRTPQYGTHLHKGAGAAGLNIKRGNFSGRPLDKIEVLYVQASAAACIAALEADTAAIMNKACAIDLPDYASQFKACECMQIEPMPDAKGRIIKATLQGGTYRLRAMLGFFQLRTTA